MKSKNAGVGLCPLVPTERGVVGRTKRAIGSCGWYFASRFIGLIGAEWANAWACRTFLPSLFCHMGGKKEVFL